MKLSNILIVGGIAGLAIYLYSKVSGYKMLASNNADGFFIKKNKIMHPKLQQITFEQLPQAVSLLIREVKELKDLLRGFNNTVEPSDRWFNLQELCEYLPDRPAQQTVYGWVNRRFIPYHKTGRKLQFRKSEIDEWIQASHRPTASELQAEAIHYINSKK